MAAAAPSPTRWWMSDFLNSETQARLQALLSPGNILSFAEEVWLLQDTILEDGSLREQVEVPGVKRLRFRVRDTPSYDTICREHETFVFEVPAEQLNGANKGHHCHLELYFNDDGSVQYTSVDRHGNAAFPCGWLEDEHGSVIQPLTCGAPETAATRAAAQHQAEQTPATNQPVEFELVI